MLVGRHLECTRLESLIDATRAGGGGAVLLRGVPGAGKSALLDFAAGRAEDLAVLRAGGIPGEAGRARAVLSDEVCGVGVTDSALWAGKGTRDDQAAIR